MYDLTMGFSTLSFCPDPTPAVFTVDPGVHYVDVKWNDVDSQGATTTIEITVTAVGSGKVIEVNPFANTNYSSSVKEYRVEGLDPGSKYTVLVKVSNEERMQRGGSPVRFDTLAAGKLSIVIDSIDQCSEDSQ